MAPEQGMVRVRVIADLLTAGLCGWGSLLGVPYTFRVRFRVGVRVC